MRQIYRYVILLGLLFGAPFLSLAVVRINEIAWMGTEKSSYGEWIELYNDSETEVDLNGAGLYEEGGKILIISLTKKIGHKSYYLIERVTPSTPDPISEIADDMGSFGGSGLKNLPGGEYLVLKLADGTTLDSIDASTGWPAGDNNTDNGGVRTMQLFGDSWITATATPKATNETVSSDKVDDSSATSTEVASKSILSETQTDAVISYSSHSSSVELSHPTEKIKVSLSPGRNRISLSGSPVMFFGKFIDDSGKTVSGGFFNWSFGDGVSGSGQQVSHSYDLPGEYVVILNTLLNGEEYVGRSVIKVLEPNFDISGENGVVYIKNKLSNEVNLKNWKISNASRNFVFLSDTIILADKANAFNSRILGFEVSKGDKIDLISPSNKTLVSYMLPMKLKIAEGLQNKDVLPSIVRVDNTKERGGDKPVDKSVEKGVDNMETNRLKLELSTLEKKLRELQGSLIASVSGAQKGEDKDSKVVLLKNVKIEESQDIKSEKASSSGKTIIRLEPQNNENAVWSFFKKIFYR